jgi:hypothetical protein
MSVNRLYSSLEKSFNIHRPQSRLGDNKELYDPDLGHRFDQESGKNEPAHYEPRAPAYTGEERFLPIPGAVWYKKKPIKPSQEASKKSRSAPKAPRPVLSGTALPVDSVQFRSVTPEVQEAHVVPHGKPSSSYNPMPELDTSIFGSNEDYQSLSETEKFMVQFTTSAGERLSKPLPYAYRLRNGAQAHSVRQTPELSTRPAQREPSIDPPGFEPMAACRRVTPEGETQTVEALFTDDESDEYQRKIEEVDHHRSLKFEVSDTEEGLWDHLGMTRHEFGQLDPMDQGAIEYQCKIQVRKLLGQWGVPLCPLDFAKEKIHLEDELLAIICSLSVADKWAIADVVAKARSRECQQSNICHSDCTCLQRNYTHVVSLFEALQLVEDSLNQDKPIPAFPEPSDQAGLEPAELISELCSMSAGHQECQEDSTGQCKKFDELSEFIRLGPQHPSTIKSVREGTFPIDPLALASTLVEPVSDTANPQANNRWFKAIALANKLTRYLPTLGAHQAYTPTTRSLGLYLATIRALCEFYIDKCKYPDWTLLSQLMLDGHAQVASPEGKLSTMVAILAKALDPDTRGPLAVMELSTSIWNTPYNVPQAMPVELHKDPVVAMKSMLNQIGPVSLWYLEPKGDSGPRILRILDTLSDVSERFARSIHNYLDQTYEPKSGTTFVRALPEKQAKKILKYELENLCKIIHFFIRTEEGLVHLKPDAVRSGGRGRKKTQKINND